MIRPESEIAPADPHWESVYRSKAADAVSWFRPHLEVSLELLRAGGLNRDSHVLDAGGGASTLVDDLLAEGVSACTVVDLSQAALEVSRLRLGARAAEVEWICGDLTRIELRANGYSHWHDRAVLHFLTDASDAQAYARRAESALIPGGCLVIGGFAPDGPERCSGLPVARRSAADIEALFGAAFTTCEIRHEVHRTPWSSEQAFLWLRLRKRE
jgi:SAM-dependent methyltransferase